MPLLRVRPSRRTGVAFAGVRVLAAIALAGASAFCAAQPTAASAPEVPNPSLADPELRFPRTTPATAPLVPSPLVPLEPPPQFPVQRVADIALVLPLESQDFATAAEAVRDGFVAAAESAGLRSRVRVVAHGDDNLIAGFEAARALGVRVVVGPLLRDDLRKLAESDRPLPLTLALNQLDDSTPLPPPVYTLTLSLESDARVLARRMRNDGVNGVAIISGAAPLLRRFAMAFAAEWLLAGGGPPQSIAFDASPDGLSALRRDLLRSNADATVIALDAQAAALARSFAPRLRAYASSLVNQPLDPAAQLDLDGVLFVDIPWIVVPEDRAFARLPRRAMGNLVLDRLYALGLDAFEVARRFVDGVPERLELQGATGRLTLGQGRHIARDGVVAVFRRGQAHPADAAR